MEKNALSGYTEQQAKEFHGYFVQVTVAYVFIALIANFLMWIWRPWFPGT